MTQARTLSWTHDGKNTDGTDIALADFRGWGIEVNGTEVVSVPRSWEPDGTYEIQTKDMAAFAKAGTYAIRMKLVTSGGDSVWTSPLSFTLAESKPNPPFGLAVA